jgi:predicted secreted protein
MSISTIKGTQLLIKVESQDSPNTFRHPCLINAKRGFKLTVSTNKIVVPDCDNPDDPAWQQVIKDVLGASIDGAGKLDTADVDDYTDWLISPTPREVQIWLGTMGYWSGNFHLTSFEVAGDRGGLTEVTLAMESDGAVGFTPQP